MRRPLLFPRQGRPGVRRPLLVAAAVTAAAAVAAPGARANHHACPVLRVKDGDTLSWSRNNCLNQHALYPIGGPKSPLPSGAAIPIADIPGDAMLVTPELPNLGAQGDLFPAMDPLNDYGRRSRASGRTWGRTRTTPATRPHLGPSRTTTRTTTGSTSRGWATTSTGFCAGRRCWPASAGYCRPCRGCRSWGCRDSASSLGRVLLARRPSSCAFCSDRALPRLRGELRRSAW